MANAKVLMPLLWLAVLLCDAALWAAVSEEPASIAVRVALWSLVTSHVTLAALLFMATAPLQVRHGLLLACVLTVVMPLARFDPELRGAMLLLFALVATNTWIGRGALVPVESTLARDRIADRVTVGGLIKLTVVAGAYAASARYLEPPREVTLLAAALLLAPLGIIIGFELLSRQPSLARISGAVAVMGLCILLPSGAWQAFVVAHFGLLTGMLFVLRQAGFRMERLPIEVARRTTASKAAERHSTSSRPSAFGAP